MCLNAHSKLPANQNHSAGHVTLVDSQVGSDSIIYIEVVIP